MTNKSFPHIESLTMLIEHNYRSMKRPKPENRRTVGEITNWKKTFLKGRGNHTCHYNIHLGEIKQYKSLVTFMDFPYVWADNSMTPESSWGTATSMFFFFWGGGWCAWILPGRKLGSKVIGSVGSKPLYIPFIKAIKYRL